MTRELPSPADLHTHSAVSDGTQSPRALVAAAAAAGIGTLALTDHDSTAGWEEASDAALDVGIALIPGMELSTRHGHRSVHLLAYLVDPENRALVDETARIRESRLTRAESIVENLGADFAITWDDVRAQARPGSTLGRPHIADALVAKGIVADRTEAFTDMLHPARGYVFPHYAPDPVTAVALVRAAGGVPVLAHPATIGRSGMLSESAIRELVDAGLFGLEIDHRENTPEGKTLLHAYAQRYGLVATGSSDFHGAGKPNLLGENTTPSPVVQSIVAAADGWSPVIP
ncbi:PHP domain-containing protein [Paramicrobacterium fandaimingii]|uniref:PHP domain-containing protein n=1 Tax=Paramicrobacterium fandaimingii TaxID=2708079 RepID=UPI001423747F|nr:PHP domain-containing protein [Microbacterium fandaimingii]